MTRGALAAGAAVGLTAGFVGGLFGVGGGIVMVPGLVLVLGLAQHRAHATSAAAIGPAAAAAVVPLIADGLVHWQAAALLLAGSAAGALAGARAMGRVDDVWLARGFVFLAVAAAIRMALVGGDPDPGPIGAASVDLDATAVGLVAVGLATGGLAALLGIGGGIVFVPALVTLYGFPQHVAQATSLAVILPTVVVAAGSHGRAGRVAWSTAATLAVGGLAGGAAGALTAIQLDAALLRRLFALLLVAAVIRMLHRTARPAESG